MGGTVGVDHRKEDLLAAVMKATNGRDVVIDFTGGPYLEDRRDFLQGDGQPDYDLYE
jgi:NADPH:quinone reductase-like Zn-dependent oxidoreductase